MGYKRCLPVNEFEDSSQGKRFQCNTEQVSFADVDTPNSTFVKPVVISGEEVLEFYNIRWYDALETDIATEIPRYGGKDINTSSHVPSNSTEDDSGTLPGATSLSTGSSDCLEFDIPQQTSVPSADVYSSPDHSPRIPVSVGPNYQATIPDWKGRVNKALEFTGTYNSNSPSSGMVSIYTVDDHEMRLMGTCVLRMPDMDFHSSKYKEFGQCRIECNCFNQGSIRCVRQHAREARKIMRETLGNENFVSLGFCDMGEEVALKWSEEEEAIFHDVVYSNPASSGRNFWKHLSAAFPSRTKKEIVSYYFNVFMLSNRAAQNRSRILEIDSDDDECQTSNVGFEVSEEDDDSAIEYLDEQDVHVDDQDSYSDDEDSDDENCDFGTQHNNLGSSGYYAEKNTTEEEYGVEPRSLSCYGNLQTECWDTHLLQHVDGTSGIPKADFGGQDDSCMSFECHTTQTNMDGPLGMHKEDFCVQDDSCLSFEYQTSMDMSCYPCGFIDSNSALHAGSMPGNLDLVGHIMEHAYLLDPCETKDCYPGYAAGPATDFDLLPTPNLIEEFFSQRTPIEIPEVTEVSALVDLSSRMGLDAVGCFDAEPI